MGINKESGNEHLWNQFARLGEMIGDGLHYESDGKWISKEYRKLSKILCPPTPEMKALMKEARKEKSKKIDEQMTKLMETFKCKCGGTLKQKKRGVKVAYCQICNLRYVARSKKN